MCIQVRRSHVPMCELDSEVRTSAFVLPVTVPSRLRSSGSVDLTRLWVDVLAGLRRCHRFFSRSTWLSQHTITSPSQGDLFGDHITHTTTTTTRSRSSATDVFGTGAFRSLRCRAIPQRPRVRPSLHLCRQTCMESRCVSGHEGRISIDYQKIKLRH